MIKVHVNAKQTPDSNIESPVFTEGSHTHIHTHTHTHTHTDRDRDRDRDRETHTDTHTHTQILSIEFQCSMRCAGLNYYRE